MFCLKQTFPPIIWIFTEGEGDGIKSRLPFKTFSTLKSSKFLLSFYILLIQNIQRRTFASKLSLCIWMTTGKHKTLFLSIINIQNQTKFSTSTSSGKVHVFCEGKKINFEKTTTSSWPSMLSKIWIKNVKFSDQRIKSYLF